jgi:hypothetical protein
MSGKWVHIAFNNVGVFLGRRDDIGALIMTVCPHADECVFENESRYVSTFYEDPASGGICIDHFYRNWKDVAPIKFGDLRSIQVEKFGFDGSLGLGMNIGRGRIYFSDRLMRAQMAARSARFEHGECGAPA